MVYRSKTPKARPYDPGSYRVPPPCPPATAFVMRTTQPSTCVLAHCGCWRRRRRRRRNRQREEGEEEVKRALLLRCLIWTEALSISSSFFLFHCLLLPSFNIWVLGKNMRYSVHLLLLLYSRERERKKKRRGGMKAHAYSRRRERMNSTNKSWRDGGRLPHIQHVVQYYVQVKQHLFFFCQQKRMKEREGRVHEQAGGGEGVTLSLSLFLFLHLLSFGPWGKRSAGRRSGVYASAFPHNPSPSPHMKRGRAKLPQMPPYLYRVLRTCTCTYSQPST